MLTCCEMKTLFVHWKLVLQNMMSINFPVCFLKTIKIMLFTLMVCAITLKKRNRKENLCFQQCTWCACGALLPSFSFRSVGVRLRLHACICVHGVFHSPAHCHYTTWVPLLLRFDHFSLDSRFCLVIYIQQRDGCGRLQELSLMHGRHERANSLRSCTATYACMHAFHFLSFSFPCIPLG